LHGGLAADAARQALQLFARRRIGHAAASARGGEFRSSAGGQAILESKNLRLVRVELPAFEAAWKLFVRRSDKRWSFTDCTSFVLMENLGIRKAVTFDANFRQAGFATFP